MLALTNINLKMSDLVLTGNIIKIFEEEQVTNSFKKREFVLETQEEYTQIYKIEFTQDKTTKLNAFKVGDNVTVNINVRGRRHVKGEKTYYFTTLNAWKIDLNDIQAPISNNNSGADDPNENTNFDDLPF